MASVSSAATSAADAAAAAAVDAVDLVNTPAGQPATERYPGALDPALHQLGEPGQRDQVPGSPAGPVSGPWGVQPFSTNLPQQAPGGGYQDTSYLTGHDGPEADWDSAAGQPFAGSGALPAQLHDDNGTGAVFAQEYVVPAAIGQLTRRTMVGQTTVRNGSGDQAAKDNQTTPNGRADLDQQQWHNPDGYDPWDIPYAERPIQNNLAYEATGINTTDSPYTPSGALPDRSVYDYSAQAYEAPPDPYVGTASQAPASTDTGIGGGWV